MKKIGVSVLLVCTLLVCTVSPIFADTVPVGYRQQYTFYGRENGVNKLTMYVVVSSYFPYFTQNDDTNVIINQDYAISITIANDTEDIIYIPITSMTFRFDLNKGSVSYENFGYSINNPVDSDYVFSIVGTSSTSSSYRLAFTEQYFSDQHSSLTIPPHFRYQFSTVVTRNSALHNDNGYGNRSALASAHNLHLSNLVISNPIITVENNNSYFDCITDNSTVPYNTAYLTYGIFSVFNNANPASGELINNSRSTTNTIQSQHDTEQSYYSANAQAIESTGLSNFQYSNSQVTYFQGVLSDFQSLWDSLGEWTFVYTFTLMLSFATFVLRHRPHTRSSTKSSGGDKNAGS